MGVCICSLAGTKACETCPNNGNSIRFAPISWPQNVQEYGDDTYQRGLSEGRKQGLEEATIRIQEMIPSHPITPYEADIRAWAIRFIRAIEAAMKGEG